MLIWRFGFGGEDFLEIVKKKIPLKSLGQMNRNLVGNIYERSSIKIAHFTLPDSLTNLAATGNSCF
jgi:hypothetical protein